MAMLSKRELTFYNRLQKIVQCTHPRDKATNEQVSELAQLLAARHPPAYHHESSYIEDIHTLTRESADWWIEMLKI